MLSYPNRTLSKTAYMTTLTPRLTEQKKLNYNRFDGKMKRTAMRKATEDDETSSMKFMLHSS